MNIFRFTVAVVVAGVLVVPSIVFAQSPTSISQTNWTLHYVDSEETGTEAVKSFDGNSGTIWHSGYWPAPADSLPHEIQINLGGIYIVTGFRYLPRQDGGSNGRIGQYEFYLSNDGSSWGSPVVSGIFANNATEKERTFAGATARYVRLRALTEAGGSPSLTSMAELNVLGGPTTLLTLLSGPTASNITQTTADITWTLNHTANGRTDYGLTSSYGQSLTEASLNATYIMTLSGLTPGTFYHYKVSSTDAQGSSITTGDFTFTTLPAPTTCTGNYYVATTGADTNSGSAASPWRTITKAKNTMVAGNTVCIAGGTYNESVTITRSGTSGNPITYAGIPGQNVIIDGIAATTISIENGADYITLRNLKITGAQSTEGIMVYTFSGTDTLHTGIRLESIESYGNPQEGVQFTNVENSAVVDSIIRNNTLDGILLYGHNANITLSNLSAFSNGHTGIAMNGHPILANVRDIKVLNTTSHDNGNQGIWTHYTKNLLIDGGSYYHNGASGVQIEVASERIIVRNTVNYDNADIFTSSETGFWADETKDCLLENNVSYGNGNGAILSQTFNCILRFNVLYNNKAQQSDRKNFSAGMGAGCGGPGNCGHSNPLTPDPGLADNAIVHNTWYNNGASDGYANGLNLTASAQVPGVRNNIFKNNIISEGDTVREVRLHDPYAFDIFNYNIWFDTQRPSLQFQYKDPTTFANNNYTFAQWKTSVPKGCSGNTCYDVHSLNADPKFTNPASGVFTLQSTSPAIDAGDWLTTITSATGSGSSVVVADARYFTDGYGMIQGDLIKLQNGQTARVTGVNRSTKTLTLDRSVSWTSGNGVAYNFSGTKPDIGAIEYGAADTTPPTTTLTSPVTGATLTGTVTLTATAADNVGGSGVFKVQFFDGTGLLGEDLSSPYTWDWDTTTATNGSHTLTAKAIDNAGNISAASPAVTVTVVSVPAACTGNYYVATTGADTNSGSAASPWRTITKAADSVAAGQTVCVRAGTYNEEVRMKTSGTSSARITFVGENAQTTIVDAGARFTGAWTQVSNSEIPNANGRVWKRNLGLGNSTPHLATFRGKFINRSSEDDLADNEWQLNLTDGPSGVQPGSDWGGPRVRGWYGLAVKLAVPLGQQVAYIRLCGWSESLGGCDPAIDGKSPEGMDISFGAKSRKGFDLNGKHFITIKNFTITGGYANIQIGDDTATLPANDNIIENSRVLGGQKGIYLRGGSARNIVRNNYVTMNPWLSLDPRNRYHWFWWDEFKLHGDSDAQGVLLASAGADNVISGNVVENVHDGIGVGGGETRRLKVFSNTIDKVNDECLGVRGISPESEWYDNTISNCTSAIRLEANSTSWGPNYIYRNKIVQPEKLPYLGADCFYMNNISDAAMVIYHNSCTGYVGFQYESSVGASALDIANNIFSARFPFSAFGSAPSGVTRANNWVTSGPSGTDVTGGGARMWTAGTDPGTLSPPWQPTGTAVNGAMNVSVSNAICGTACPGMSGYYASGRYDIGAIQSSVTTFPPLAPTLLTAVSMNTLDPNRVRLTWQDNSTDEAGFTIERATDPAFTAPTSILVAADVVTFDNLVGIGVQDISVATTYYYRVSARNAGGLLSLPSGTASARVDLPSSVDFSIDTYRIRKVRTKLDGTHVLTVKAKVKNAGPASAQAKVKVTVKKLVKIAEKFSAPIIILSGQRRNFPLVRVEWKGNPQKYIAEICAMPVGSAVDTNHANDCVSQEITVPPTPAPRAKVSAFTKNLSKGSTGSEVTKVQQCLASELYLETAPTGIYGPQTEVAIKEFQTDEGIPVTGVWNADTMKAANEIPCFGKGEPTPSPTPSASSGQTPTPGVGTPTPADGASGVALSSNLSWQAPADATSYYIYFGTSNPPPLRAENITERSFNPGTLQPNTTYYWRVAIWTASDIKVGPIWSFTTGDAVQPLQSSQAPAESSPTPTPTPSASSGQATPPPSQQIALSITEARFTGTPSLKINGAAKEFTFTLANSSGQILTGISYKAWIEQNGTKGSEVSKQITCGPGPGKVPVTGCKEYGTVGATSPLSTSGSAQAVFQIIDSTGAVITQTSIPVTLTGGIAQAPSQSILAAISGGVESIINSLANWLLGY